MNSFQKNLFSPPLPDPLDHAEVILADAYSMVGERAPLEQKIEWVLEVHQEDLPEAGPEYWAIVKAHLSGGQLTEKHVYAGDRLRTIEGRGY